jgi:hypothetical protein
LNKKLKKNKKTKKFKKKNNKLTSMPISSPPQDYVLEPIGTSGLAVGPELLIVDDDLQVVQKNVNGNIFIRGSPCFGFF